MTVRGLAGEDLERLRVTCSVCGRTRARARRRAKPVNLARLWRWIESRKRLPDSWLLDCPRCLLRAAERAKRSGSATTLSIETRHFVDFHYVAEPEAADASA